jgi:uncharacterized protein
MEQEATPANLFTKIRLSKMINIIVIMEKNRRYMRKTILLMLLLACNSMLIAQVKKTPLLRESKMFSVSRATKNEILIRWALADEGAWAQANKYGYALERYTVVKDGKVLDKFERSQAKIIFKPRPVNEWDSVMDKNDYAAVLAQSIYGDDFDVEMTNSDGVAQIINETEKLKQRYNMAMYAADHSFDAAEFAGLGWKDKNVKPGDKYFYRIYSLIPKEIRKTDTALLYVGLEDYKPLPKPSEILTEFSDKMALLKWDFDSFKEYYTSYIIERSDDGGKTFKNISDKPVTSLNDTKDNTAPGSMLFIDSLANNDIQYQYRIAGISLFGDTGPYSEIVKGKGKVALALTPNIKNVTQNEKGEIKLNWEFADSLNSLVKEFRINHAPTVEGPYRTVRQNINVTTRSIDVDNISASNYYTITAISKEGEERTSLPYLVQPEDSIAPAMPVGLRAVIDSNGIVSLSWKANQEKDMAGYRILKTNVKGQELVPLFDSLWYQTEYKDTVNIKSLNNKIYYTVRAVDGHYNQSGFAQLIEVKIPDVIPPSQPVLGSYDITEKGIKLSWINSSDEDVAQHKIYRKIYGENGDWQLLQSVTDKKKQDFIDEKYAEGKTYSYTIIAEDSSKLESAPAVPLTISIPEKRIKEAVTKLNVEVDRDNRAIAINWQKTKESKNIRQFEIYRGEDRQPMSLYQEINTEVQSFTDKELRVNTTYKYGIRAVYTNGGYSDFVTKTVIY